MPSKIKRDWRPVLKGFVSNGQIHCWCPYCGVYHHHSYLSSYHAGHRSAHCDPDDNSPFLRTGYFVIEFTQSELQHILERYMWRK